MERDRFGVRIIPDVAELGADRTGKVIRYSGWSYGRHTPDNADLLKLKNAYALQAQEFASKAFGRGVSYFSSSRMLGKAAYAMRQAVAIGIQIKNDKEGEK